MGVEYELDVDEVNQRWAGADHTDAWSQFILKQTDDTVELITQAPPSGIWRMAGDGSASKGRFHGVPPAPVEPAAPRRTFASKLL